MSSTVNNCCGYRDAAGGRAGHRIEDVIPSSAGSGETHSDAEDETVEGWTLREVTNGTAVLEGPNGIWRTERGDTVPGVGGVHSIVRCGGVG